MRAEAVLPYAAIAGGTLSTILGAVNLGSVWHAPPGVSMTQKVTAGAASALLIGMGVTLSTLGARELRYIERDELPELEE
jgi:hypothetical protein